MVPILAKQALARKCEFSNARMTGNYECAYALGVVSGALAIPKEENAANLVELKNKIEPQYKKISSENLPASNLVFLIDVSGSMLPANKLPLVQASMKLLTDQLREKDKVTIVTYAGSTAVVLPTTSGEEKIKINTHLLFLHY